MMHRSEDIVAEARSWLGTPYAHRQCVKGRGVDCAMLLAGVFAALDVVPLLRPEYPPDWHLHRGLERFRQTVETYADRLADHTERAGDVVLFRFGRTASHAAIIEDAVFMIHADLKAGCVERCERARLASRYDSAWRART